LDSKLRNKLNDYLKSFGVVYDCESKEITDEIFDILQSKIEGLDKSRQEVAYDRAKRNLKKFDNKNPAKEESSTKVHKLIKEIDKYI